VSRSGPLDFQRLVGPIEEGVRRHGPTPKGLWGDRNSEDNGVRRLDAMFDMLERTGNHSLLDLGCGTGLTLGYMEARGWMDRIVYCGIDISAMMIDLARREWPGYNFEQRDIISAPLPEQAYDYTIINGAFTSKFTLQHEEMEAHVQALLGAAWPATRHALAFNVLSIHVDWQRPDLFHWPVDAALAFCKSRLSRHVVVRADYGLYEYTVQVYRSPRPLSGPIPEQWLRATSADGEQTPSS
jgi:SAM-dependent methyltransferase